MVDSLRGFVADYKPIDVVVVDSQSISAGLGYQVKLAARLLDAGLQVAEILPILARFNQQVSVWFVVADLKHLLRTGRISGSMAFLGNLLAIKPVLSLVEGKIIPVGKERTARRAYAKIGVNVLTAAEKIELPVRFDVIDANNPEAVAALQNQIKKVLPECPIDRGTIGPAVGVHTGEASWVRSSRRIGNHSSEFTGYKKEQNRIDSAPFGFILLRRGRAVLGRR
nr:DegV family protein [Lacticaseibacillus sharpeae]